MNQGNDSDIMYSFYLSILLKTMCFAFRDAFPGACFWKTFQNSLVPSLLHSLFHSLLPSSLLFPRLGIKLELQLPAYTTATETWDPRCVCDLHHSSRQHQILNPLSKTRDRTHILMDTSWIHFCCATMGSPFSLTSAKER